ncbi:MAG: tyrosine-type recombinase/integrase [Trebonia sp.]
MSGTPAARELPPLAGGGQQFAGVLAGVCLDGPAGRLAALLDPGFLSEAGWDPVSRVLSPPPGHELLGRVLCRVSGCAASAHASCGVCYRCMSRLEGTGMMAAQIAAAECLPPDSSLHARCLVPGCLREPAAGREALCRHHGKQFRSRARELAVSEFLADPRVRPLGPPPPCAVTACARPSGGHRGYCGAHYQRWRAAVQAAPDLDARRWQLAEPPVSQCGQVSLQHLPPLVIVEVLFGVWQRTRDGAKITESNLRMACRALAVQQVAAIADCDTGRVTGKGVGALLRVFARDVRRAMADPASEQARDIWDLGVFGHPGRLDFTGITQPWLRDATRRWAAEELPLHRGRGASKVREKVSSTARLSESLRARPDQGCVVSALSRRDIENFLNRLGYLESQGTLSRYQRNVACRDARAVLTGIRALGLTRPGQPADGLPGDVIITAADIPAEAERGEPGRDLPAEIMAALCAGLGMLEPAEARTAVQIAIDTGRRPEDIVSLPLDCLARDADGAPVLVYDNLKAGRMARRLPVSQDTAEIIIAQQELVAARFPATARAALVLLPSPRRNPAGRRPMTIDMLEGRHREWAARLSPLRTRDGAVFDPAKIVPYAYRHTYAQRHADAGIPLDVLAELLDHRNLNVTRGYYRVGEDRRRDAVDKVTAMQFDRHGNRTWRDARDLLDAEHARYAIGQVAVPYGTCAEPSNVAAGGNACPVRFRCAGCDHFRTDVSYLPDLTAYLDDLLRTRERLAAMTGVDDWARAAAAPSEEEITRIRRLIAQIEGDITQISPADRAGIDVAVAVIRKHRAVNLGMPAIRTRTTAQEETA